MNETQERTLIRFIERQKELLFMKGHDYSGSDDTLSNFRELEEIGISSRIVIFTRLSDKYHRLKNFFRQGVLKVSDESLEDTLVDMANYAALLHLAITESKSELKKPQKSENKLVIANE